MGNGAGYTFTKVITLDYSQSEAPCPNCGKMAKKNKKYTRVADDISIENPRKVAVWVSSHYCQYCKRYFTLCPDFLRKHKRYTNRAREKCLGTVIQDVVSLTQAAKSAMRNFNITYVP